MFGDMQRMKEHFDGPRKEEKMEPVKPLAATDMEVEKKSETDNNPMSEEHMKRRA